MTEKHQFMFCHFRENEYRWQNCFITRNGSGYKVQKNAETLASKATFNEAAELAGTTSSVLKGWIEKAQQANIYCITLQPLWEAPGKATYVEISLRGSTLRLYGFRYVPSENAEAYEHLMKIVREKKFTLDSGEMSHIEGQWFYFEGVR